MTASLQNRQNRERLQITGHIRIQYVGFTVVECTLRFYPPIPEQSSGSLKLWKFVAMSVPSILKNNGGFLMPFPEIFSLLL